MFGRKSFAHFVNARFASIGLVLVGVATAFVLSTEYAEAQSKIYMWTDKNGVVHFSDSVVSSKDFENAKTIAVNKAKKETAKESEIPLLTFDDRPAQKFVRAQLESDGAMRDVLMLVDTGAQISLVDQALAEELALEKVEEATLRGVNGITKSWIGRLPAFRLGDEEIRDLRVLVGPQPGLVLLGMDVLDHLNLSVGPKSLHRR
ncbi:MAG: retroviral-like aspartic protease family protein [Candidatus Binatia bacterium]